VSDANGGFEDSPTEQQINNTFTQVLHDLFEHTDMNAYVYFSNGGGVIGAGTHAAVAEANRRWLETGATCLPRLSPIAPPPLPSEGMTQFVAVTQQELRGALAREDDLGDGRHELTKLFYAAQDVITQIRLSQEG
jgi:hypothetical protein